MPPLGEARAWSLAPHACTAVLLPLLSGQTVHKPAPLCDFLRTTIHRYMLPCVIHHDSYTTSMYACIYLPSGLRQNGRSRCANLDCNPCSCKGSGTKIVNNTVPSHWSLRIHAPLFTGLNSRQKPAPLQGAKMGPQNRHTPRARAVRARGRLHFGAPFFEPTFWPGVLPPTRPRILRKFSQVAVEICLHAMTLKLPQSGRLVFVVHPSIAHDMRLGKQ